MFIINITATISNCFQRLDSQIKFLKLLILIHVLKKMYQFGFPKYSIREALYSKSIINLHQICRDSFYGPSRWEKPKGQLADLWQIRNLAPQSSARWVRTPALLPSQDINALWAVGRGCSSTFCLFNCPDFLFLSLFLLFLSYFVSYIRHNKWRI